MLNMPCSVSHALVSPTPLAMILDMSNGPSDCVRDGPPGVVGRPGE